MGLGGAAMQAGATGKAAGQATKNLQMELPQFQANYNTAVGQFQPYANVGPAAVKQQQDLLGLNGQAAADAAMQSFQQSPGYQWALQQGLRGVDASAAARGMLRSGATLKGEEAYGQGLANQEFGNYFNRLGTMANTGFQGATGIVNAGNNLANAMTGNVAAQNTVGLNAANQQSSIFGDAAKGIATQANQLFNNTDFQNWAKGLFSSGGSTFTPSSTGTYGGQSVYTGPTNVDAPATYNF